MLEIKVVALNLNLNGCSAVTISLTDSGINAASFHVFKLAGFLFVMAKLRCWLFPFPKENVKVVMKSVDLNFFFFLMKTAFSTSQPGRDLLF